MPIILPLITKTTACFLSASLPLSGATRRGEEYSIDECFADLTGLRRHYACPMWKWRRKIKHELDTELGFTFSVGLPEQSTGKNRVKVAEAFRSDRIPGVIFTCS